MKTRDRILHASLELFNAEGEANVTALDVANVLEISPGNLYYHFKGKDALIQALFENFEAEMDIILRGADGTLNALEDHWVFLYILLEEIYDLRFFYRSLGLMTARYSSLGARLNRLSDRIRKTIDRSLDDFGQDDLFAEHPLLKSVLLDQLVSILSFWLEEDVVRREETPAADLIHKTVLRTLLVVAPYLKLDQRDVYSNILAHYDQALG